MTKLEKIEQEIAALSESDRRQLAQWFAEFHSDLWDNQIEADYGAGRLDRAIGAARKELREGNAPCEAFGAASFWECYEALPDAAWSLADKNFELLKLDPSHPSLRFRA